MSTSFDAAAYTKRIASVATLDELSAIEHELFGRKQGAITLAMKNLSSASPEEKKELGKALNIEKKALEEAIAHRTQELDGAVSSSLAEDDTLDTTIELPPIPAGHVHLIPEFIRTVEEVFARMGFDVADGNEIETEEFNFDLLNFPKHHAARDMQDVFYMKKNSSPDNRWLLRAHTSPVQVHYMQEHKPPFRMICPGKVYRKDHDATHSPMFHQFEGLMIDKDISLANMKAVMIEAMKELISDDIEFRFRSSYFPFVEPGLEVDMRWRGSDSDTKEGAWLEVVGCGMVHPNVLKNVGIDPSKWQGFAFGFGIERLLMIKHQIRDLRSFYEGDLRFLKQF